MLVMAWQNNPGALLQAAASGGVCKVTATRTVSSESDVWLLPHLVNETRPALHAALSGSNDSNTSGAGDLDVLQICRDLLSADAACDGA